MGEKTVNIVAKGLMYLVAAVGILFVLLTFFNWDSVAENRADIDGYVGTAMYVCYAGFILAAVIGIGFGIYHFLTHIKQAKGTLIGLIVFIAVLVLSYVLASDEVLRAYSMGDGTSPSTDIVKMTGAGIIAFYALGILAIVAAIFAEISRLFK